MLNMNCNFNKFKNLLGVYRVVIDSVLDNNNQIIVAEQVKNLVQYFEDFKYTENDNNVKEFINEVLDTVDAAYAMVDETLRSRGLDVTYDASSNKLSDISGILTNSLADEEPSIENQLKKLNTNELSRGVVSPKLVPSVSYVSVPVNTPINVSATVDSIEGPADITANYFLSATFAERLMRREFFNR